MNKLAKVISKQSVVGATWFHLVAYSKIQEDRDNLKEILMNYEDLRLGEFENSQFLQVASSVK